MKNHTLKKVLLAGVVLFLFACNSSKEAPGASAAIDKEKIKQEIQAKENDWAATYNSGELKNIGYYADDATSFFQNRPALTGKEDIIEFLRSDLVGNSNKISFKTNEVFVSSDGNMVLEIGYFTVVDSTNTGINKGNYMSLFEKRDGKYVCVRDMSASDIELSDQ